MNQWSHFEFKEPYHGPEISHINKIPLPSQYIDFMKQHNGGEGEIGENWFILFSLEELQTINDEYEVQDYLPGNIIIGSDGGGELYGVNAKGQYFNIPFVGEKEDICWLGQCIEDLPKKINEMWNE